MMERFGAVSALFFVLGGCQPEVATLERPIEPEVVVDENPAPDIVEVTLVAHEAEVRLRPGHRTKVWTYNGSVPGPTIEGKVGDTLIVHFFNDLPEATTIHWHGLELPANMDGAHIAQRGVAPGGYFRYEFKLLHAATFWYHPHIRSDRQIESGLHGGLIVHDPHEQDIGLPTREHLLVLDDVLLDKDNQLTEFEPTDPLEKAEIQINGREGNVLLVNGRSKQEVSIRRGVPHRFRLVNVSNTRFMRISIPGQRVYRVGGDGGLLQAPIEIPPVEILPPENSARGGRHSARGGISNPDPSQGVLLTPGERADLVFTPTGSRPIVIEWHDTIRGRHSVFWNNGVIGLGDAPDDGLRPARTLLRLHLFGPHRPANPPPAMLRVIEPIDIAGAPSIPIVFGHTPPTAQGDITFFVQRKNGMPLPFDQVTPADAPSVTVGETRIWEINNLTGGDHNFHLHGFSFQPIETVFVDLDNPGNNVVVPAPYLEIKDTVLVPRRPGAGGRSRTIVRLAARFDDTGREGQVIAHGKEPGETTSGGWLFHCHLLEHAELGMMSFLQVFAP